MSLIVPHPMILEAVLLMILVLAAVPATPVLPVVAAIDEYAMGR